MGGQNVAYVHYKVLFRNKEERNSTGKWRELEIIMLSKTS
jgi:hypothetical protein